MPKKSIWDSPSKYGTYTGPRGNPQQWANGFKTSFENSNSVDWIKNQNACIDAYSLFHITPSDPENIAKKTIRKILLKNHPDKGGNVETYQKYLKAYDIIKNTQQHLAPHTSPIPKTNIDPEVEPEPDITLDPDLIIPQLLTPIDESELPTYINNNNFCAQEKKDGKHITLQIKSGTFLIRNKKGIASTCSPEFESDLRSLNIDLLIDGEQINSTFHVWDILELDGLNLRSLPYETRYNTLTQINFKPSIKIVPIARTLKEKIDLYNLLESSGKEGIVFKNLKATFTPGKGLDQLKFKFYSECSIIVVQGRKNKASIGMELLNNGIREFVGYCSCSLYPLPPINSIAEIKYLYAYKGGCLYQPSFKEPRDDVSIEECTTSQLKYKPEED
jgi:bifunctional non-homologous end joining protein LigD